MQLQGRKKKKGKLVTRQGEKLKLQYDQLLKQLKYVLFSSFPKTQTQRFCVTDEKLRRV